MGYLYEHLSEKYPNEVDKMLTYHHNIQTMMARQANWRSFDYHFRVDREYVNLDWDTVRSDLERDAYRGKVDQSLPFRCEIFLKRES